MAKNLGRIKSRAYTWLGFKQTSAEPSNATPFAYVPGGRKQETPPPDGSLAVALLNGVRTRRL